MEHKCEHRNIGRDNVAFDELDKERHNMPASDAVSNGNAAGSETSGEAATDGSASKKADSGDISEIVDDLQKQLGGYGRYQMLIFVLIGAVYMRGGWQLWIPTFQVIDVDHHCTASPGLNLSQSVPGVCENGTCVWEQCTQYVNISVSNATSACRNGWTYILDSSYTSIVSEFDLVCDNAYQQELTSTIYMVGSACGVLFLTPLADKLGAKAVMLVCLWVQAVIGTCLIWSGNIIVYCVLKFFIGVTNMTVALCSYVLMTETFDTAHREVPTIALQFFWALGIMSMALFGYLIPEWQYLQLTITLPINVLSLIYIFIIPEPLPWLLSKGKVHKAEQVIKRFIRVNNLPPVSDLQNTLSVFKIQRQEKSLQEQQSYQNPGYETNEKSTKDVGNKKEMSASSTGIRDDVSDDDAPVYTVLSLFKTRRMRIYTLLMFYIFMINSLAYYGIMFSTPDLNGNRFLNLFLLGVVEIPAYILCLVSNKFIGRRRSIAIFLFICAAANLTVIFIPNESDGGADLTKLKTALVIIGKFGITGSYSTIYLYASEVFPTVIRNQGVGASSFFENIGSIAAPNMVYANNSMNNLPLGIFGGLTIVGCGLVLLLPETQNRLLPQTIDDVENGYGSTRQQTLEETYKKIERSGFPAESNAI
ncbi:hypothetical protein BsWGS_02025 [Bradybaena similaris]